MTPIFFTATDESRKRVNPIHLLGWQPGTVECAGVAIRGSMIMLSNGVSFGVLERSDEIDMLFEEAMGPTTTIVTQYDPEARPEPEPDEAVG